MGTRTLTVSPPLSLSRARFPIFAMNENNTDFAFTTESDGSLRAGGGDPGIIWKFNIVNVDEGKKNFSLSRRRRRQQKSVVKFNK
jgi:hypothetical protein